MPVRPRRGPIRKNPAPARRDAFALPRLLTLAALLLLSLSLGLASAAAVGDREYLPELGLFAITLPAGTSYVTLPLVPVESTDPLDIFGPEILAAVSLESYDAATRGFQAFFPTRPGAAAGEQRLYGNVLRITVQQQTTLTIRGTPSADAPGGQLAAAVGQEFLGAVTADALPFRDALAALEQTGRFRFGSDALEIWNVAAARFDSVTATQAAGLLLPGTTLRLPANGGATPPPPADPQIAYLDPQTAPPLQGALDPAGAAIDVAAFPLTETAPTAPGLLTEFRYRQVAGATREGIGRLELPANLRSMTDLPASVPVKIHFAGTTSPRPVRFQILGLQRFKAGGKATNHLVSGTGSAMDLSVTTSGELYGYATTPLPALRGSAANTLPAAPVSVYFKDNLVAPGIGTGGQLASRTGPVLDLAHSFTADVRIFRRYTRGLDSAAPTLAGLTTAAPNVHFTKNLWLEYRPEATGFLPAAPGAWAPSTVPATLRTLDGATVASADSEGVTSLAVRFPWMTPGTLSLQALAPGDGAKTVRYAASGTVEVTLAGSAVLRSKGTDVSVAYAPAGGAAYEFEVTPVAEAEAAPPATANRPLESFTLAPILRFSATNFAETENVRYERLLLLAQPQGAGKLDLATFFTSLSTLVNGLGAIAKDWGKAARQPFDLETEFQQMRDALKFDLGALSLSLASEAKFKDTEGAFTQRLTLSAAGDVTWSTAVKGAPPSFTARAHGGYEDLAGTSGNRVGVGVSLSREYASGQPKPKELFQFSIDGQFSLPEEWGFADKAAAGQWVYQHEATPAGLVVNRGSFRAANALSFRGTLGAIGGLDFLEAGGSLTQYAFDLAGVEVALEAVQSGGAVSLDRKVAAAFWTGVSGASPESEANATGFLLDLALAQHAAGSTPKKPPAGSPGFLTAMFGGPSIFASGTAPATRASVGARFQGFGNDFLRLDSIDATYESSEALGLTVAAGFRFRTSDAFTECVGQLETAGSQRSLDLSIDGLQILEASGDFVPDFDLTDAHVHIEWSKSDPGPLANAARSLMLGGNLSLSGGLLQGAGLVLGIDIDCRSRVGLVTGELTGPLFCSGSNPADCPIKSGSILGSLDLGGRIPKWRLELAAVLRPPWLDTALDGTVLGVFAGLGNKLAFSATLAGLFPTITLPAELGGIGGSIDIGRLSIGYDQLTKIWSYAGLGRIGMPNLLVDLFGSLGLPRDFDISVEGIGPKITVGALFSPPPTFAPLEGFSLGFDDFKFTRLVKWAFAMKVRLKLPGFDLSLDAAFDAALKKLRLIPPPDFALNLKLDLASLGIKAFTIDIFKDVNLGGAIGFNLTGFMNLGFDGRIFKGLTTIGIDSLKNFNLDLQAPPGLNLIDIEGIQLTPILLNLSSRLIDLKREFTFGIRTNLKIDDIAFGPLNGLNLDAIARLAGGLFELNVLKKFGPLRLELPDPIGKLPFELTVDNLTILKKKGGDAAFAADVLLSVLRPLNAFFGAQGDRKFNASAKLKVEKIGGKRKVFVDSAFNPALVLPFNLLVAAGELIIPSLLVSTEGDLALLATLNLREPITSALSIEATVDAKKRTSFLIQANPRLVFDIDLLHVDFAKLGLREVFSGFMGIVADFAFEAGLGPNKIAADVKNLLYVLPSSLPPVGFPFFDRIAASTSFLGFGGQAVLSLPAPELTLSDAIGLVAKLTAAIANDNDSSWEKLRAFLASKLTGSGAAFRGPGVGDIALLMPNELDLLFPSLEKTARGLKLVVWSGLHYATDFFPGSSAADAIVRALRLARVLLRVVVEPSYLIELIPEQVRANEFSITLPGLGTFMGAYALKAPEIERKFASNGNLPDFGELCVLLDRLQDPEFIPSREDVDRAAAAGRSEPALANSLPISGAFTHGGTKIEGTVTDTFSGIRTLVERTLALVRETAPAGSSFDFHRSLVTQLKTVADRYGGAPPAAGILESTDKGAHVTLSGLSPRVAVTLPGVTGAIFTGQVPLAKTTLVKLPVGELTLVSSISIADRKLYSDVSGTLQFTGAQASSLGRLKRSVLAMVDEPAYFPGSDDGRITEWSVDLSDEGSQTTFSHLGTVQFTGPGRSFSTTLTGGPLKEVRAILTFLKPFQSAIFDQEASPYVLGLKVWSLLRNDAGLAARVRSVRADGRTIAVSLADPATGATRQLRIVLEDLAYYQGTSPDPANPEIVNLVAETPLSLFRVEGNFVKAQPFSISLGGESAPIPDLTIFDGSAQVRSLIDTSERQQRALLQSDLAQFVKLGLTVNGDPMIVRALRLEVDGPGVRAVIRPRKIEMVRTPAGSPLVEMADSGAFETQLNATPPDPGLYRVFNAGTGETAEVASTTDLHAKLGTNALVRTVKVTAPASLAGTLKVLGPGEFNGNFAGKPLRVARGATEYSAGDGLILRRDKDGRVTGTRSGKAAGLKRLESDAFSSEYQIGDDAKIPGSFEVAFGIHASLEGLASIDVDAAGKIEFDGAFLFEGTCELDILDEPTREASFKISSTDGVEIEGGWGYLFFDGLKFKGRITPKGNVIFDAKAKYLIKGTGLKGELFVNTSKETIARFNGQLRFFGATLFEGNIKLKKKGFEFKFEFGNSNAGGSVGLAFTASQDDPYLAIRGSAEAHLNVGVDTLRLSQGVDIGLGGLVSLKAGECVLGIPFGVRLTVSLRDGSFSITDVCH